MKLNIFPKANSRFPALNSCISALFVWVVLLFPAYSWAASNYGAAIYGESKKFWVGYADNIGLNQIATSDGGAILVGSRISYPFRDLVLVKLSADGNIVWQKKIDDTKVVSYQQNNLPANLLRNAAITATPDGNFEVTFATESFKDVINAAVVKFSENGNVLWHRLYKANFSERTFPTHIVALSDGSSVLMGNLENQINQTFLIKIANDGQVISHAVLENSDKNQLFKGRFLTKSNDGSLIGIASMNEGDAVFQLDDQLQVVKISQYFNEGRRVNLRALQQRADGVIGVAMSTGTAADSDLGFLSIDSNGHPISVVSVNASAGDEASCIVNTLDGGFFVGGFTGEYAPDSAIQGAFIPADHAFGLRVDPMGNLVWAKTYNTKRWNWKNSREIPTAVTAEPAGDLSMGGGLFMSDHWGFMRLQLNSDGNMPGSSVKIENIANANKFSVKVREVTDISAKSGTKVTSESKPSVTSAILLNVDRI